METEEGSWTFKYQFADDTLLGSTSGNAALATRRIEAQFTQVNSFFNDWGIEVNEEKTNYMILAPPKLRRKRKYKRFGNTDLKIGKTTIKAQKRLKYLGITFQKNGKYDFHAREMTKKGRKLIGASRFLLQNRSLTLKCKRIIYKMLIRPGVTYACAIWHNNNSSHKLDIMERWACSLTEIGIKVTGTKMCTRRWTWRRWATSCFVPPTTISLD